MVKKPSSYEEAKAELERLENLETDKGAEFEKIRESILEDIETEGEQMQIDNIPDDPEILFDRESDIAFVYAEMWSGNEFVAYSTVLCCDYTSTEQGNSGAKALILPNDPNTEVNEENLRMASQYCK